MPTQIVKEITDKDNLMSGAEVTQDQLNALSKNLFAKMYIIEKGVIRDINCSNPKNPIMNDTKTAYFDKDAIMELFSKNPTSDGLLIYFGVHDKNIYPALRQPGYQNKLMVVLATATSVGHKQIPHLDIGHYVEIAGSGGGGTDNGKLCPPDTTCGS